MMNSAETFSTLEGSAAYRERQTLLQAIVAEKRTAFTKVGRYEFRAGVNGGWEAKASWGVYSYAVPVANERDAMALALGLAGFQSKSAGRGKRYDIKIVMK